MVFDVQSLMLENFKELKPTNIKMLNIKTNWILVSFVVELFGQLPNKKRVMTSFAVKLAWQLVYLSGNAVISGNKMDTLNLATLFAPNLMHSFNDDLSSKALPVNTQTMDHVPALRLLIERRDLIYQVPSVELNDAYIYLNDRFPDVLDALLRRRSALAGIE